MDHSAIRYLLRFSECRFLSLPPSSGVAVLASFGRSWHSHIPLGLLFNFQGTVRRSFTYSHRERSNAPPKREKYLRIKNSLHSFGQRVPKCTPIFGLSSKNFLRKFIPSLVPTGKYQIIGCFWKIFYLVKSPLTYLELRDQNATCFSEKRQKNLPSNIGGHTFDTNNIIDFLKYSERIHIGWIICQKVI